MDGEPATLRHADFRAMAVAVPAGVHEVRFEYHAPGLAAGLAASGLGVFVLLLALWRGGRLGPPQSDPLAQPASTR